ncbi:cell division cycle protein 16 homolog [Coccinella septempunctata]|uniref:cell division cycle protein 16 homolog n=1 Tax=Coccinella septempunctata TaxID=41139 RepID=UPI001D05E004|nr:cell division cycle protein 16 homolog [Coccinella septempunctata]
MKTTNALNINVDKYRKLVQHYLDLHMPDTALFWADKVVTLTENPRDIYWLAKCMYHLKQYHRAVHLLKSRKLDKTYILCNYLTVKCLFEANDLNEALNIISNLDYQINPHFSHNSAASQCNFDALLFDDKPKNQVFSAICFLKGRIMECLENRVLSVECYKQALHQDVYCFEAFDALTRNQMLTATEEKELLNSLPISEQCSSEEAEILRFLYESKLKKYHETSVVPKSTIKIARADHMLLDNIQLNITPCVISNLTPNFLSTPSVSTPNLPVPRNEEEAKRNDKNARAMETETPNEVDNACLEKLKENLEIITTQAERYYYNCEFSECAKLTDHILNEDPWHIACLPIHISCHVELKDSNRIFLLAHNLVDLYPNLAISWYAVGCYYYITGKSDCARRYLMKATCLDKLFGPAWLAYGHSFALENEHDQAMAAYFKASQLMKGCHLPLLYIGLECGLTNNVRLAEKFFQQSQCIAPDDPFILHEKGVINYQNHEFKKAESNFKEALQKIANIHKGPLPARWVPLLSNLGHTCRKLKKYNEALEYHHKALLMSPRNASIYSAIGFVHALVGNTEEAVDWFHKALGLDRGDTFSSTMLNCLIEELADERPPYDGAPMEIPKFIPRESSRLASFSEMDQTNTNKDLSMSLGNSFRPTEDSQNNMSMSFGDIPPEPSSMSIEVDMEVTRD